MPEDEFLSSVSDSNSYDPNGFYVAARNKKGFKTTLYLAVSPEVASGIGELVAMKVFPHYKTPQDIHRNGLVHILHRDRELTNDPNYQIISDDLIKSLTIESEVEKIETILDAERNAVEKIRDLTRQRIGDTARSRIQPNVKRLLDNMTDPVAKDQIRQALDEPQ